MPSPSLNTASRARLAVAGLLVWGLVVLGLGSQTWATYAVKGEPLAFGLPLLWAVNGWVGWLGLAPVVFWLARRFPVERPFVTRHLAMHVLFGVLAAMLVGLCFFAMELITGQLSDATMSSGALALMYLTKNLVIGVLVYGGLVSLSH